MDDDRELQLEGAWDQVRGRIRESWGVLTDDELDRTAGRWEQLIGVIKEKTGEDEGDIERKLNDLLR
ncbi:MAG: CsbD family protein [Actinomycetota bacterium]|nr:CsbD family protein [Actinomycetota bacterium]